MKKLLASLRTMLLLPLLALGVAPASAQTSLEPVPALADIKSQEDVEFYHDQGGVTLGRAALTESVKNNICGKVTRELVPGSLQVYYMKGFGAVEIGVHRFHHPGHEDTEPVGEAKFIHLWQYEDGAWKITRIISYDHHAVVK